VIGNRLGDPERYGLDAAFPALFLALLITQIDSRRALAAALAGGTIALVLIPFAPPGVPIIAATAACLIGSIRP
jgi:predicted branched-subunit amino acid permease